MLENVLIALEMTDSLIVLDVSKRSMTITFTRTHKGLATIIPAPITFYFPQKSVRMATLTTLMVVTLTAFKKLVSTVSRMTLDC